MTNKPLAGKKIAVLVESEYIPHEIEFYKTRFEELGATVDLMSRLWGQPSTTFVSDIDPLGEDRTPHYITVDKDFSNVDVNDYAAVLMAANYCSVRLRYFQPPAGYSVSAEQVETAPAVKFFAQAMTNKSIVKGALCHGLWILTPTDLLKGRKVICHTVVLADVLNAGAVYEPSSTKVVVDDDLVTAYSAEQVESYVNKIVDKIVEQIKYKHIVCSGDSIFLKHKQTNKVLGRNLFTHVDDKYVLLPSADIESIVFALKHKLIVQHGESGVQPIKNLSHVRINHTYVNSEFASDVNSMYIEQDEKEVYYRRQNDEDNQLWMIKKTQESTTNSDENFIHVGDEVEFYNLGVTTDRKLSAQKDKALSALNHIDGDSSWIILTEDYY